MEWKEAIEKQFSERSLVKAIKRSKCSKSLGKGRSATLGVYKVCEDQRCTSCAALKLADYGETEARIFKRVDRVVESGPFRDHVLRLIYSGQIRQSETYTLITDLLPSRKNLGDISKTLNTTALKVLLIQIFETLAYIRKYVPGFVHMDLGHNVIMVPWKTKEYSKDVHILTESLPCSFGGTWVLPPQTYWPILIDFGNSRTNEVPNDVLWGKYGDSYGCGKPSFDIYKLLTKLRSVNPKLIDTLMEWSFGSAKPVPLKFPYYDAEYQLPLAEGCALLGDITYSDVLKHPEFRMFK